MRWKLPALVCGALALGACVGAADDASVGEELDGIGVPDAGTAGDDDPIVTTDPTLDSPLKLLEALTVTRAGAGAGVVVSSPAGIACGTSCAASFRYGTIVTLSAAPATGSIFAGWTGACAGAGATCTLSMTASRAVGATFAPSTFTLAVTIAGSGPGRVVSSPGGIDCAPACTATYPYGTTVTLTAIAQPGSSFAGWSGACAGNAPACTVTMTQATAVTAMFTLAPVAITIVATGDATGTISLAPGGQTCAAPGTCTFVVDYGTAITLAAAPATGALFAGWSGACAGTAACTIVATQPITVGAEIDRATYNLTVQRSTLGTVTGAGISCGPSSAICTVALPRGTSVELDFTGRATSRTCMTEDANVTGCDYFGGGCTLTADHDAQVVVTWFNDCSWWY